MKTKKLAVGAESSASQSKSRETVENAKLRERMETRSEEGKKKGPLGVELTLLGRCNEYFEGRRHPKKN